MTNRRLLIFQETPIQHPQSPTNPLTPSPQGLPYQVQQSAQQFQYIPINKLGLPVQGPGSLPEGLRVGSLLNLPLRVISAFTEIFNGPKYKGWAIVAAGPYNDPTLGVTGKFYAVVLEQTSPPDGGSSSGSGGL